MNWLRAHQGGRLSRLLFWLAAAFAFVMAVLPHPPQLPASFSDKIQHITAFAVLGMLASWAFPRTAALKLIIRLSLFGAAIELFQAIPALHRDSDVVDWIADTIACALFCSSPIGGAARSAIGTSAKLRLRLSAAPSEQEECMTSFNERERAFETKFAHDEEMRFRITARRNRLLGEWAARKMGLTEAESESYAKDVIRSDFEEVGDDVVVRKVLGDLTAAGIELDEDEVKEALRNKEIEARRQIIEASNI